MDAAAEATTPASGYAYVPHRCACPGERTVKPRTPKGFATQEAVVPKSRVRKRTVYTPPPPKSSRRKVSPPWVGPTIVALLVVGLAWIAVYYISQNAVPGLSALGNWNLVVGFVLIVGGVTLSTRWR
jgi:Cell division protein CrgA